MRVQVRIGTSRPYTYEAPEGTSVGDTVLVPPAPWQHDPQLATVVALGSDYPGEVKRTLNGWPAPEPARLDWDMRDWSPADLVVEGIVMALEGCGHNEDPAAVVTPDGRQLRVLGVRRSGQRAEIVVEISS